jgi:hypothetical protein
MFVWNAMPSNPPTMPTIPTIQSELRAMPRIFATSDDLVDALLPREQMTDFIRAAPRARAAARSRLHASTKSSGLNDQPDYCRFRNNYIAIFSGLS